MWIPIRDAKRARSVLDASIEEVPVEPNPRRAPLQRVRDRLRGQVPDRLISALPQGFDHLGDVVLIRLPEPLEPYEDAIGHAYGVVLDAATVLALEGARGELREPQTRHLWGETDTETVHREEGLIYHLDPARVLFSTGNHHERHRLAEQITPDEHVVDLFAGVGYFTLPAARAGARVIACEKNPVSVGYLATNAQANELADRVEIRQGDAREVAPEGLADRVLMGYFPGTEAFLTTALAALAPQGGLLHYHTTAEEPDAPDDAWQNLQGHEALADVTTRLADARRVKGYAPGVAHVVLDIEVTR